MTSVVSVVSSGVRSVVSSRKAAYNSPVTQGGSLWPMEGGRALHLELLPVVELLLAVSSLSKIVSSLAAGRPPTTVRSWVMLVVAVAGQGRQKELAAEAEHCHGEVVWRR